MLAEILYELYEAIIDLAVGIKSKLPIAQLGLPVQLHVGLIMRSNLTIYKSLFLHSWASSLATLHCEHILSTSEAD